MHAKIITITTTAAAVVVHALLSNKDSQIDVVALQAVAIQVQ
jgi:hypothetical protein